MSGIQNYNNRTIPDVAREAARKWPHRTAIHYQGQDITFAEQHHRACCLARGLQNLGIGKGDHVATLMGGCPEWFYLSYAVTLLGAVLVPINVTFRERELDHALRCSDARVLVTVDSFRNRDYLADFGELIPELASSTPGFLRCQRFPCLETVIAFSPDGREHPGCFDLDTIRHSGRGYSQREVDAWHDRVRPDDTAYILFTSGSTAFPKPALRCHGSSVGIAHHVYGESFQLGPADALLGLSPFYHVAGCVYTTLGCAAAGARIVLMSYFEPGEALRLIATQGVTALGGFDTHFRAMAQHADFAATDVSSVARVSLACGPEWYDKVQELGLGGKSVAHHYGFTEGTSVVMPSTETEVNVRKNSNGRPFPGTEVKIINPETGSESAANEPGEICVRGWTLFQGYYKMPAQTAGAFDDEGFFHSGDYGWKDTAGNIYYRGRYKQMIKTGGENVSEREVEMFLEQHPRIENVQIVGVPDEQWGEAVTAMVEPFPDADDLTLEQVRAFCREQIAGFKIPRHLVLVTRADWPITMTGKYDKPALRRLAMERLGIAPA